MAESFTIFGRIDNSNAANANVNVQPGAGVELIFQADGDLDGVIDSLDGDTPDGGDLKIDGDGLGGIDGNTTVSIDGGLTYQTFTFILSGTYPDRNNAPAEIIGQEIILLELEDGTRVFFFTEPELQDQASANGVPQGAAAIQNISTVPDGVVCFAGGTRIQTPDGERAIQHLRAGDLVSTLDHGAQPIRWIGARTCPAYGALAPIRFEAGVFGALRPLLLSPQHRVLVSGLWAELLFGEAEVLAKAKDLVNGRDVRRVEGGLVQYWHMLFDTHEIVFAEGAATESLHPGDQALKSIGDGARREILSLFPELVGVATPCRLARPALKTCEARALVS